MTNSLAKRLDQIDKAIAKLEKQVARLNKIFDEHHAWDHKMWDLQLKAHDELADGVTERTHHILTVLHDHEVRLLNIQSKDAPNLPKDLLRIKREFGPGGKSAPLHLDRRDPNKRRKSK